MSSKTHHHDHKHGTEAEGKLSPYLAEQRYKQVARFINESDVVLDIGCGAGGFIDYLPKGATYYGIDSVEHWPKDRKNLYKGILGKSFPKELEGVDFTVVTALAIIEHLKKPEQLFIDASKQIKKGTKLILTTPHPLGRQAHDFGAKLGLFSDHASHEHETFLDKELLRKAAKKANFEMIEYRRFLFGMNQVAVFEKLDD